MIISTPQELRAFLPNHVMTTLDDMAGFLDNSEADFLAERIGAPLLAAVNAAYASFTDEQIVQLYNERSALDLWQQLVVLCQRCIVFDAFSRAADIQSVSVNNAGLNVTETQGYDAADTQTIAKYKAQCVKEAHAASNRLLIQLETWQKSTLDDAGAESQRSEIVELWKQSAYYYFADGLLFNTATEFGLYVNIYESREKFIQLLPDIRYCQEVYLESEIGEELLHDLIEKHKTGALNAYEQKAYVKLQRWLSLKVEARSPLFKRPDAKDEAMGQMNLALDYIRRNQSHFDETAMQASPLYDASQWQADAPVLPSPTEAHLQKTGVDDRAIDGSNHPCCGGHHRSEMLISSLI